MNPETLTTSQIVNALTPKHWVAIIAILFTAIGGIASGSYWAGQRLAEVQAVSQISELKSTVSQIQAKLEIAQSKIDSYSSANTQWINAYNQAQQLITQKNQEIGQLSSELGRANNCVFVQNQIVATKKEIELARHHSIWTEGKEQEEKKQRQITELEKRMALFQQQLGTCNR